MIPASLLGAACDEHEGGHTRREVHECLQAGVLPVNDPRDEGARPARDAAD